MPVLGSSHIGPSVARFAVQYDGGQTMSQAVRQVWSKAVKHGRQIFQNFGKNGGESGVGETPGEIRILKASGLVRQNDVRSLPRLPFWEAISKRSGSGALAELRRRAALRLTSLGSPAQGGRVSNLALVGFGLAVGSKCYGPVDEHGYNIACHHIKVTRLFKIQKK